MPRDLPRRPGDQSSARQPHDHLAGVAAAQEVEERGDGLRQPLPHGLADDEVARGDPAGDGLEELAPQIGVVAHEETAQGEPVGDQLRHVARAGGGVTAL